MSPTSTPQDPTWVFHYIHPRNTVELFWTRITTQTYLVSQANQESHLVSQAYQEPHLVSQAYQEPHLVSQANQEPYTRKSKINSNYETNPHCQVVAA